MTRRIGWNEVFVICGAGGWELRAKADVAAWRPDMNIHHLELFYYVAKNGGISRAVRAMPYGIQQPAVSSQILLLEEDLGIKLFERTPFKLTREGEELYAFARPFFDNVASIGAKLRQRAGPHLRVAGSELVLRDYLPSVIERLRKREPKLKLGLRSGFQAEMEKWLLDREVELAITPLEGSPPAKINCRRLMRLPMALLVPKKSKLKSAEQLWQGGGIDEPLICLPPSEAMSRLFRGELDRRGIDWPHSIEASSLDLVSRYVANGYGVGLSVKADAVLARGDVRFVPLEGFPGLDIGALWIGELSPLVSEVLDESKLYIETNYPEWKIPD
jgi:DNA-binding transcriptional LysR family regulator